jgi:hypothetical protein
LQAPPPTTVDPETQRQLRHLFDHASDPVYDLVRILITLVIVALILLTVAVILAVAAQWLRTRSPSKEA